MNHIVSVVEPERSWCGSLIAVNEQPFKTVDQAAMNGIFPSKKPVCADCINLCVQSLLKNIEVNNEYEN